MTEREPLKEEWPSNVTGRWFTGFKNQQASLVDGSKQNSSSFVSPVLLPVPTKHLQNAWVKI